jgi:hypothetical protein
VTDAAEDALSYGPVKWAPPGNDPRPEAAIVAVEVDRRHGDRRRAANFLDGLGAGSWRVESMPVMDDDVDEVELSSIAAMPRTLLGRTATVGPESPTTGNFGGRRRATRPRSVWK